MSYKDIALRYAEQYGIVDYQVKGNLMTYLKSYPAAGYEPHRTYKHTVNLDTGKSTVVQLKRFNKKGFFNT